MISTYSFACFYLNGSNRDKASLNVFGNVTSSSSLSLFYFF